MDTFNKNDVIVISSAPLIQTTSNTFLYKPYEIEMQIWAKHAKGISFCCPVWKEDRNLLIATVSFDINQILPLQEFDVKSKINFLKAIQATISNVPRIFKAMKAADHIHLRCPGNIGLLGCFVQILFPSKIKTAKYAGNWDPESKQPWSYRLQKWILSNTFLTKNMQVLVYGEWAGSSSNVKPFFTATYSEGEKVPLLPLELDSIIRFVFVGSLVKGKNPMYSIQLVEKLLEKRNKIFLDIYGEGILRETLEGYVTMNNLSAKIIFHGNQNRDTIKESYQHSHFVILPSQSEGWPKAIAEGMFWGCVPLATSVSCVPFMLDFGNRGILLKMDLDRDIESLERHINNYTSFESKRNAAADWSRQYTLDRFKAEIKKLLHS